jgi:hypothetical protein
MHFSDDQVTHIRYQLTTHKGNIRFVKSEKTSSIHKNGVIYPYIVQHYHSNE